MRKLILTIAALALLAAAAWFFGQRYIASVMHTPGPHKSAVTLEVRPGMGVRAVLTELERAGALQNAGAVALELRRRGSPTIKAGRYEIPARATPAEILAQLAAGRVVLESLTIVEGWTFADMRRAIAKHAEIDHTLAGKTDAELMRAIGHAGEQPEGRFLPDTYRFAAGSTDVAILRLAYDRLQTVLTDAWDKRTDNLPLKSPYEALILASIVEKETGLARERPQIAGVFTSRLRKGMRLQTDPTVIYGLGERYDGNIRERDLRSDTPYNTYTRSGLPPTPIALAGADAIVAATQPLVTGHLYFVATGLPDGSHAFSRTYEEHNKALQQYLARLRSNRSGSTSSSQP